MDCQFFRRRRPSRPSPAKAVPNSARLAGSGTRVPGRNVSGPVPKENVAAVTVVLDVMPDKISSKVAGPIVYGSKFWNPLFTLLSVPPFETNGTIISFGWPPPIASKVIVFPTIEKKPVPPGGGGPSPRNRTGEPET